MKVPLNWLKDYVKLPKDRVELTDKLTLAGHMLDKVEQLNGNTVIDLELRGNRADCYSILGIAREVSALFATPIKYPTVYKNIKRAAKLKEVNLEIKTPLVKRVMMTVIKDVKIEESPKWLKQSLTEYGMESINNIVDLTNFVMIETGEPMHAFDLDKIGNNLSIRLAKKGEKMLTFMGKTLTLTDQELVWANDKNILSVAGAIGEKTNSISNETKNILLEAASYDRANIRRSIHRHTLFTDAGIRHEKELDPNLVSFAVARFMELIEKNNWGVVTSTVSDYYPKPVKPWSITLNYEFLKTLGGVEIDKKQIKNYLVWLGFEISKETSASLEVLVPTYRTDVVQEEDVVEEILRIYGYDKIPTQVLSLEVPEVITPNYIKQEVKIKTDLVALGLDEVISIPFVKESLLNLNKPINEYSKPVYKDIKPVRVSNKPSPDTEVLRMSLLPNLYDVSQKVKNERGELLRLFEVGKVYAHTKSGYIEKRRLGIISWSKENNDYYHFKGLLDSILEKIGLNNVQLKNEEQLDILSSSYNISVKGDIIGQGGRYKDNHYVEIDLDSILDKSQPSTAKLWAKYPPQIEDITFVIPEKTLIGNVVFEISNIPNVQRAELKDIYNNAYTFRVWYQNPNKTLTNQEVEKIRQKVVAVANKSFGARLKD